MTGVSGNQIARSISVFAMGVVEEEQDPREVRDLVLSHLPAVPDTTKNFLRRTAAAASSPSCGSSGSVPSAETLLPGYISSSSPSVSSGSGRVPTGTDIDCSTSPLDADEDTWDEVRSPSNTVVLHAFIPLTPAQLSLLYLPRCSTGPSWRHLWRRHWCRLRGGCRVHHRHRQRSLRVGAGLRLRHCLFRRRSCGIERHGFC